MATITTTAKELQKWDVIPDGFDTNYRVHAVQVGEETTKVYVRWEGFSTTLDFGNEDLMLVERED